MSNHLSCTASVNKKSDQWEAVINVPRWGATFRHVHASKSTAEAWLLERVMDQAAGDLSKGFSSTYIFLENGVVKEEMTFKDEAAPEEVELETSFGKAEEAEAEEPVHSPEAGPKPAKAEEAPAIEVELSLITKGKKEKAVLKVKNNSDEDVSVDRDIAGKQGSRKLKAASAQQWDYALGDGDSISVSVDGVVIASSSLEDLR